MAEFRWIEMDELPKVQALADHIWWKHYHPDLLSAEQIRFMLDWMYSLESLRKQMSEGYRFLLAEQDSSPVGYASVFPERDGVAELSKFYLSPEVHGQGLGRKMLQVCETAANAPELQLWVYRMNIGAINFYFRQGFRILQTVDRPIGQGFLMQDFVMQKRLSRQVA